MKKAVMILSGFFAVGIAAFATQGRPTAILPTTPEPEFESLFYSEVPAGVNMIVKMSTKDMVDAVIRKYPATKKQTLKIDVEYEFPIKSTGQYFRRVAVFLADSENINEHGTCGQPIAIWFAPDGNIKNIYVNKPVCPV